MTNITTEQAQHIASNLDGVDQADLMDFIGYVGPGFLPKDPAEALFPSRPNRVAATASLRAYALNKTRAMESRVKGQIADALGWEGRCERNYSHLPQWAKW